MTKQELRDAYDLASGKADLSDVDDTILHGCYLPDYPPVVHTSILVVAKFARWEFKYLNGDWDHENWSNFCAFAKRRIIITGNS